MRKCVSLAVVAGVLAAMPASASAQEAIDGQYIVVLKEQSSPASAKQKVRNRGGKVQREFSRVLKGFSAELSESALADVRRDPAVAFVEPDRVIALDATQTNPPWGLDRIDQRPLPLSSTYTYAATGANVTAYVIDTGIRLTHNDFGGRAVDGYDAVDGALPAADCNGHGTHVAGTVGGTTYGVAKGVRLVAVRVLNCSGNGTTSGVIAGIDWVTSNHTTGAAVANMSLGGGVSSALDLAVGRSIADGVTYVVAAGNSSANACNSSPARVPAAITVGSTTSSDARSSFSNYGSCLDVFAPGSSITSAWYTSNTAASTISGTSMASPHVAGAAAVILQGTPSAAPAAVRDRIYSEATQNAISNPGSGSPNRLLYTGGGPVDPGPTPTPTPTPAPTCAQEPFGGTLASRASAVHPAGGQFTAAAGTHRGCLRGPAGTDFDLYLERWNGSTWAYVARGITSSASETVNYTGPAGTYRWRVFAYSGSGAYTFEMTRP